MLRIFRTNQVFTSVLLLFYAAALKLSVFWAPFNWTPTGQGWLSEVVYDWIHWQSTTAQVISIVLLMVQGFMVNYIVLENRLSNENTLLPGVFYVMLSCAFPDFLYLSPVLLGNTFFLFGLSEVMKVYKRSKCADHIFNAGFWVGVASLFYFPFIFMAVVMVAAIIIQRAPKMRELLLTLIGTFTVLWLVGIGFFLADDLAGFLDLQFTRNFQFLGFLESKFPAETWIKLGLFFLLLLWCFLNSGSYLSKKNIEAQKKITILYWVLGGGIVAGFFQKAVTLDHLLMLTPALGVFIGFSFEKMKASVAEAIHFILFVSVIVLQLALWLA
ncbi:MAG: hypothetical protein CMN32_04260 [Saprospirales bacterium]|nr:hypothetical protein [Saprospirales bacterium]